MFIVYTVERVHRKRKNEDVGDKWRTVSERVVSLVEV